MGLVDQDDGRGALDVIVSAATIERVVYPGADPIKVVPELSIGSTGDAYDVIFHGSWPNATEKERQKIRECVEAVFVKAGEPLVYREMIE